MKAYLIDPRNRSVSEVEYTGDYRNINHHIGADTFDMIRMAALDENGEPDPAKPYDVFVDDEGLINGNPDGWFMLRGYGGVLRGRGLVLSHNEEGESVEPKATLADIVKAVGFPTDAQVFLMTQ